MLLCGFHHRFVHEEGWRVEAAGGDLRFRPPDGPALESVVMREEVDDAAILELGVTLGIRPETNVCGWDGEPFDLGAAVEAVLVA